MTETAAESTRAAQKERTRQSIMDAALRLSAQQGFAQISLRQVARDAGVVPTAFYRHFASMDELGLALVEQSFSTLRTMIREAQRDPEVFENIIDAAAEILVRVVKQNREHFGFVARERTSGSDAVRDAIQRELELFIAELSVVLVRLPHIGTWSADDIALAAGLFVRNMVYRAEEVVRMPPGRVDREEDIKEKARREMRMIVLGFEKWQS